MKNAFWKDAVRYIRKSAGRFFGTFAIVALGVFTFAGLGSTGILMQNVGDAYFDEQNFMDIQVISTYGINGGDLDFLMEIEGVAMVTGGYSMDALAYADTEWATVKVDSMRLDDELKGQINMPRLLSGRYPEKGNEVLVEPALLSILGLELGDNLRLEGGKNVDIRNSLRTDTFRIVGTIQSPLYFSSQRGSSTVGSATADAYIVIPEENFKQSVFNVAYITVQGASGLTTFTDEYEGLIDDVIDSIKEAGEERLPVRRTEATRQANLAIAQAEEEYRLAEASVYLGYDQGTQAISAAQREVGSGYFELAQSEIELTDSYLLLDAQEQEIESGLLQIQAGLAQVDSLESQLRLSYVELNEREFELAEAEEEIVENKSAALGMSGRLDTTITLLDDSILEAEAAKLEVERQIADITREIEDLTARKQDVPDSEAMEIDRQIDELRAQLEELEVQLLYFTEVLQELADNLVRALDGQDEVAAGMRTIAHATVQANAGSLELAAARIELNQSLLTAGATRGALLDQQRELEWGREQVTLARQELDEAAQTMERSRTMLWSADTEIRGNTRQLQNQRDQAVQDLEAARLLIADNRKLLQDLKDPKWYVLGRDRNMGYAAYQEDCEQVGDLGTTFPLIFFLVAALVSLTTMSRIVDEQRTGMGTLKALGYSDRTILCKFILYAIAPTFLGGLVGGYLGVRFFPAIILDGVFSALYAIPPYEPDINLLYWGIGLVLAVCSTLFTTISACRRELKEVPAQLMRPRAPQAGKKTPLEYVGFLWRRLSFLYKVTFRNIFRYKKRLFMTLAGVGGSTALLLMGLGLNHSMDTMIPLQYRELVRYDMMVTFADDTAYSTMANVNQKIQEDEAFSLTMIMHTEAVEVHGGEGNIEDAELLVPDNGDLATFFLLRERVGGQPLELPEQGAVITEIVANAYDLSIGDELTIRDADDDEVTVVVAGIMESYLANYVVINADYYREVFGKAPEYNSVYAIESLGAEQSDVVALTEWLKDRNAVNAVTMIQAQIDMYEEILSGTGSIVILIVFLAAILSIVVLVNLTTINIAERAREIATIEVLGFRDGEVSSYIYREMFVTSFVAAVIGCGLGKPLHTFMCASIEGEGIMMPRGVPVLSYLAAIILTMLFAACVALLTNRQLKRIDMLEALKSNE